MFKPAVVLLLALPVSLHAATLAQRYESARRIAMKDRLVRVAYQSADQALAAKIVAIDPALKSYKPGQRAPLVKATPPAKPKPAPPRAPIAKATPKPAPKPIVPAGPSKKHKVAPGETLEGIAILHHVGVPTLKQANPGVQPRNLQPGQVLIVPIKNTMPPFSQGIPYQKPAPKPGT